MSRVPFRSLYLVEKMLKMYVIFKIFYRLIIFSKIKRFSMVGDDYEQLISSGIKFEKNIITR